MQAVLIFNLPDEKADFDMAVKAMDYYCAWTDLYEYVRGQLKYQDLPDDAVEALEGVREMIVEIERERGLLGG